MLNTTPDPRDPQRRHCRDCGAEIVAGYECQRCFERAAQAGERVARGLCQHCDAPAIRGLTLCEDHYWTRKEANDGTLDSHLTHGITDARHAAQPTDQPPHAYRVCAVCSAITSEWFSQPSAGRTLYYCPRCVDRLGALATRAKAASGDARLTDWPQWRASGHSHTALMTTRAGRDHANYGHRWQDEVIVLMARLGVWLEGNDGWAA